MIMNTEDYERKFDVNVEDSQLLKKAFAQVSDIRKFEIELYWKRATYFWALIAVAFFGYFSILSSEHMQHQFFLSLIVSCIGLVFTFAWFLSSRGSKYSQENWENHLDLLEDKITGPLYKTLLERAKEQDNIGKQDKTKLLDITEKLVTAPLPMSASKINQWVGLYVMICWFALGVFSFFESLPHFSFWLEHKLVLVTHLTVIIVTISLCVFMFKFGKSHRSMDLTDKVEHKLNVMERDTKIV